MQDWLSSRFVQHEAGGTATATTVRTAIRAIFILYNQCLWIYDTQHSQQYQQISMSMNKQRASTSPSFAVKISRLEESFRQAYMSHGEPLSYCNTLLKSINSQQFDNAEEEYKYKMYNFADEINLIKQGDSFPQTLKKLVIEREEIIRQLRSELISNRNTKQLNLTTACEKLDNLRMYSLIIIEKVHTCKRKLQVNDSLYFNQILQKLGQDVDFLRLSALRKFIEFSNHNDPLFMVPLRKFWSMEIAADSHRRPIIDLFTLDADYHKRLDAADRFIRNTEKVDGTTQQMLNQIDSRSIIEKAIEQSEKNGEGREQYISTLQKFTLPSLRGRQKTEQAYTSVKTKEVVSNLIKEVISEYKMRSKEKSVSNYNDKKKGLLSRSIERPREALPSRQSIKEKIDVRPNNIRYKMGKAASLKSNGLERQYYEEKQECQEQQSRGRLVRYSKRLPQIQKQEREEYSHEKINEFQKYLLNQQYDNSSNPSSKHIDFKSMRANEIELSKYRQLPGKIKFNQLGSKMHTEPTQQLRYDISNRIDRANDNKMSNNHSMKNSSLIEHNPTFRAKDFPDQQERITTPPPNPKKDSTPRLTEKSNRHQTPKETVSQSPLSEAEPIKSARACWISQQFSYHQIVNNISASPEYNQGQSPKSFHKTAELPRGTEERTRNLRINFQFDQQIYSPPFVPKMKIPIPNDEGQNAKQAQKSKQAKQQRIQNSNMSPPIQKQKVATEAKEVTNPPFSIRQMPSSAQRYDAYRIQQQVQAQNGTSQRTSQNMSQKIEEHPHKNSALKQSQIKQILEESQSSMDNKSSNHASIQVNMTTSKKNQNSMTEPIAQQKVAKTSNPANIDLSFKKEKPSSIDASQQAKPEYDLPQRQESSSLSFHPPQKSQILPNYAQSQSPYPIQQRPPQLSIDNASSRSSISTKANGFPLDKQESTNKKTVQVEEKKPVQTEQIINNKVQETKSVSIQQPKPAQSLKSKNEKIKTESQPIPIKTLESQTLKKQQTSQVNQIEAKPAKVQQANRQQKSQTLLQKQDTKYSKPSNLLQTMPMISSDISIKQQEKLLDKPLQKPLSNQRMVQMLQKCAFQSKPIKHQDLLQQLTKLSPINYQTIRQIIDQSYFAYRQIYITNCLFDGEICCYCLYYPQLSSNARTIFILHIEIVKEKFTPLQIALYNTFVKYIFINDPCENIICINYSDLVNKSIVRQLKNFEKEIPSPLVADKVSEMAYLLARKDIKCAKQEELTSILTFINTFASNKVNNQLVPGNDTKVTYGANYLKKVGKKIVKENKSYSINQLNAYLTEEELPKFKTLKPTNEIFFTKYIVEECFLQSKFFVYSKDFYFTIDYPHTCLYQGKNAFFLVVATSAKGKYFIFADKLYEEDINLAQAYKAEIQGKQFDSLFNSHKSKGKIVTCPTFRKTVESPLGETPTLLSIQLNWKDYLKGVRYMDEEWIHLELVCPFLFGLVQLDQQKRFQLLCRTAIEDANLIK